MTRIPLTPESAAELYEQVASIDARPFLDYLIDHPGEQLDSEVLQRELGLAEHKQVALSAYAIGEVARRLDMERPWIEAQRGYTLPDASAELLQHSRVAQ